MSQKYSFKFESTKPFKEEQSNIEWEAVPRDTMKKRRLSKLESKPRLNIKSILAKEGDESIRFSFASSSFHDSISDLTPLEVQMSGTTALKYKHGHAKR